MTAFGRALADGRYAMVVAVTAAQMGKTDTFLDVIGQRLDQRPAPILYVGPGKQFLLEQFEPRFMSLLDEAPGLRDKVLRGKRMTKTRKLVAGVPVRLAHAGSSSALKSDKAALAIVDEYDEMLRNVKGQGDPLGLVMARGDTYAEFAVGVASTPSTGAVDVETDEDSGLEFWKEALPEDIASPIWKLWQSGTRHHFTWLCPHCRGAFVPRFKLLKWPEGASPAEARANAWIDCPRCGAEIRDSDKKWMNAAGDFVAPGQTIDADGKVRGEPRETSVFSVWSSGLCSPFVTWGQRAERFVEAARSGEPAKIQTALNAGFGELYAPGGGEVPEWMEVAALRRPYRFGDIPVGVAVLTCAVDVQKNRLVWCVRGWGARATSWLIAHGELWGATDDMEVWSDLDDLIETPIGGRRIRLTLIDSGFRPDKPDSGPENMVYDFCRRHQRNVRATKGRHSLKAPLVLSKIEVDAAGKRDKVGLELVHINTDWAKLWVHERIRWPDGQPGAWYLAEDTTDDYCQQVVSEARLRKPSGRHQWVARTRNNHALDLEAMQAVAGYLLNVQRIAAGDERPQAPAAGPAAATRTSAAPAPRPRAAPSQFMRR